jgi:hypothetical protein
MATCPIQIDDVRLPLRYRAMEKPTIRNALTVATPLETGNWKFETEVFILRNATALHHSIVPQVEIARGAIRAAHQIPYFLA